MGRICATLLGWTAGLLLLLLGLVVLEIRSLDQPVLLNASVSRTIVRENDIYPQQQQAPQV